MGASDTVGMVQGQQLEPKHKKDQANGLHVGLSIDGGEASELLTSNSWVYTYWRT